ncbi:MAG: hypothetical protein VX341_00455 [Bdellovibrionota bacterium]|nr:hypothetical protein [Bdellovibrionota bacterium]
MLRINIIILFLLSFSSTFANVNWDEFQKIMEKQERVANQKLEIPLTLRQSSDESNLLLDNNLSGKRDDLSVIENFKTSTSIKNFKSFILKRDGKKAAMSLGNDGPHGGDSYGSEFSTIGYEIALSLSELNQSIVDDEKFMKAIESVVVYSDESSRVTLNSQIVDALNFPNDNIILVNRDRWRVMNLTQKIRLVFHEYLGIINSERDVYKSSVKFNQFFLSETKRLKELRIQNYYGYSKASQPLSYIGSVCDENSHRVKRSITEASKQARARCRFDDISDCENIVIELEEVFSSNGIRRCLVTSIVK